MQRQFLDAIQMMAASLQSGYSVENAVCASAKELEKLYPRDTFIVLEFQNMALQLDRNQSVESLLQDLGERSQVEDLQSFAEVFLTVKRTGGDLLHVIRNTGLTEKHIQQKSKYRKSHDQHCPSQFVRGIYSFVQDPQYRDHTDHCNGQRNIFRIFSKLPHQKK